MIIEKGKLLIVRHGPWARHPLKWEFPGGKIKPDENERDALRREILEELDILVEVKNPLSPVTFHGTTGLIRLIPFVCKVMSGELRLIEHLELAWVFPEEVTGYDILPADRELLAAGGNQERINAMAALQRGG